MSLRDSRCAYSKRTGSWIILSYLNVLAALSTNEYTVRVLHAKRTHISTDVIEFGDEGMLDDIHCNL